MTKGTKNLVFYVIMVIIFTSLMYLLILKGESHQGQGIVMPREEAPGNLGEGLSVFYELLLNHVRSPFGILLLQIIVILVCCRFCGWLFLKIKQPTVIGEILAGIILGPSILGYWLPGVSAFIFPPESLDNIGLLSQFGLILFMFAIGMELNITEVRSKLKETILISHTSIIVPFFLGMLMAYFIYDHYAGKEVPFLSFALFIGIAMSITAFPVLARIIQEKGLTKTHLGIISLASAANGDIIAWCLLAVIIAIVQAGSMLSAVYNVLFSALYIALAFLVVRPFLRMVGQVYHNEEVIDKGLVAFMFLILITSSFLTEILGLHALFGAFIAGVIMPSDVKFRQIMAEKVEAVALSLFLPLFFVLTGLKTEIGLLNTPGLWGMCGLFILVAVAGKFGGAAISARFVGESWKNSLYIGALMNTRGLMELIILTIGYEMNILSPTLFTMLILMTLFTTFMTAPLIFLIKLLYRGHSRLAAFKRQEQAETFKVLLSFGRAGNGQIMLNVAQQMFSKTNRQLEITALHLTSGPDVNPLQTGSFESVSFNPILHEAEKLGIRLRTRYEVSNHVGEDITSIVNEGEYNFLLVGAGITWSNLPNDIAANQYRRMAQKRYFKSLSGMESWLFSASMLKDKTRLFIRQSQCPVGVFINRDFESATRILVIMDSEKDFFLFSYLETLLKCTRGAVAVLNRRKPEILGKEIPNEKLKHWLATHETAMLLPDKELSAGLLKEYNFMLVSYKTWNDISENNKESLQVMPSTLIISQ
jgi:Kef-type K+ transport system membrane component KefB